MDYFFAPEKLVTDAFAIRSYLPGDGVKLAEALNASYEHLKGFMSWPQPYTTDGEGERRARIWRAHYLLAKDFTLGIFSPEGDRLLGSTGFHPRGELEDRRAETGMWLRPEAAGQGLGARVLCAMLDWGFNIWPWERIQWRCSPRNFASRRTAEKAEMFHEGTLRAYELLPDGSREDVLSFVAVKGVWENPYAS